MFELSPYFCSPGTDKCPDPTGFANRDLVPTPEPATFALFGTALRGFAGTIAI
jgi:hypothetical protein